MLNQLLHKAVQDISKIIGLDCAIWDKQGVCQVRTNENMLVYTSNVKQFQLELNESDEKIDGNVCLFNVYDNDEVIYVLAIEGNSSELAVYGKLGANQLSNLLYLYRDKMDRNKFFQNILLNNLLLVDIYNQAKKMNIPIEQRRGVFVIESKGEEEWYILETLKGVYAAGTSDYITAVDEQYVIVIKSLENNEDQNSMEQIAKIIRDTLNMEAMVKVRVAYGTIVDDLKDIIKAYKEAEMALEAGRVFYPEKSVLAYSELGIGRLIHSLSASVCEKFLNEVFGGDITEILDDEDLTTIFGFLNNNLIVSEAARQLHIHRNTLLYRLDKIQKKTGLDVRKFEDSLTFKIALMVTDHLKSIRN